MLEMKGITYHIGITNFNIIFYKIAACLIAIGNEHFFAQFITISKYSANSCNKMKAFRAQVPMYPKIKRNRIV